MEVGCCVTGHGVWYCTKKCSCAKEHALPAPARALSCPPRALPSPAAPHALSPLMYSVIGVADRKAGFRGFS